MPTFRLPPRSRFSACLLAAASLFGASQAFSGETLADDTSDFQFSGFGTAGVAATSTDNARFIRDQTQPSGIGRTPDAKLDSLLGLQARYQASKNIDLTVQAISRYGPHGDFRPEISWAFARFSLPGDKLVLRTGRLGTELYMMADSRHVAYSYLSVRPPVDFFGVLAFHHLDGADLTATLPVSEGILKLKTFAGLANEEAPIGNDEFLSLRGNPILGVYADYQAGDWQWRATYAQMTFRHDLPVPVSTLRNNLSIAGALFPGASNAARALTLEDTTSRFYSLGAVYDRGPLQVQAMFSAINHESQIYQHTQSAYLLAGYRLGEFTPYAAYSWSKSNSRQLSSGVPDLPAFASLNEGFRGALARTHIDQHTYTLGTRWDFQRNMALKAQVDLIRGKPESVFLYPSSTLGQFDGKLDVFSLALDFVF